MPKFDTLALGPTEKHNMVPSAAGQVQLARTIADKVEILKKLGARFYASPEEYDAGEWAACLNAWKTKSTGELGPLVMSRPPRAVLEPSVKATN